MTGSVGSLLASLLPIPDVSFNPVKPTQGINPESALLERVTGSVDSLLASLLPIPDVSLNPVKPTQGINPESALLERVTGIEPA